MIVGIAVEPGFLGGEDEDRRKPGGEAIEHGVEHRARRSAGGGGSRVAIEDILADVEIEGREIEGAKIMQACEQGLEIETFGEAKRVLEGLLADA